MALLVAGPQGVRPVTGQDLGTGQFQILGTSLDISPETQAVPVGIPTLVHTSLPSASGGSLPPDLIVRGEFSGPGISGTVSLATTPNADFRIPGEAVKGEYVLSDIRLVEGDTVLAYAIHRTAVITVTDVLITQVTSRPLTYQEMVDQGIVVSKQDFSACSFSFSMVLDSKTVTFEVPIVFSPNGPPILPKIPTQSGAPPGGEFFRPPQINALDLLGNVGNPSIPKIDSDDGPVPLRIPTLLLIPGDVAFLNQFFSVSILVQNGAPANSNLVLQDVTATPRFPGNLQVKSSTPAVNLGDPVPIRDPGPDGILGTIDDVTFLVGQAKGNADFVVEGLRSGTYDVPIDVRATIAGLPTGPLSVSAQAHGTILVRHPSFFVTFDHPDTIRAGETYFVSATVTNTSTIPANQVQIALDKTFISGTELISDPVVQLGSIDPHDNVVARFQFKAARTGRVQATAVFSEGSLGGAIQLQTGIGDLGIAVSPDTLILPTEIDLLPQDDLVTPARQLLGLGWSLAKSPAGTTDPTLPPVGEQAVRWRVQDLALAARHQKIGEVSDVALAEWILEWLNSDTREQADTFDLLRRESASGAALAAGVGRQLSSLLSTDTPQSFSERVFRALPELPHTSLILSEGSDPEQPIARLSVTALGGAARSAFAAGENEYVRGVPNAEIIQLTASGAAYEQGWIGGSDPQPYQVQILGQAAGVVDFTLEFPGPNGSLVRATFAGIPVHANSIAMVSFVPGQVPGSLTLQGDGPGVSGTLSLIPAPALTVLAAAQDTDADPLGRAISALFNRSLQPSAASSPANYRVSATHDDAVQIAKPQPSDARLVVMGIENHPSPYLDWSLEVHGLVAAAGASLDPSPQALPITITDLSPGGAVSGQVIGADGKPVPNAEVVLRESATSDVTGQVFLDDFAVAHADAAGQFSFDYVPLRQGQVFELDAADPVTGYDGTAFGQIHQERETVRVNIVLLGRGDLVGTVKDLAGNPLPGSYVTASSVFFPGSQGQASTNAGSDGSYGFTSLPVGPVQLWTIYQGPLGVSTAYQSAYIPAPGAKATQDIVVALARPTSISGTVTHEKDGTPAAGLYVVVYGAAVSVPWPPFSQRKYFGYQITDSSGQFGFPVVSSGSDEVQVFDPARGWMIVADQTLNIVDDRNNVINFVELDPQQHTGSIQGHVYVSKSGAVTPDANAIVWLSNSGLQVTTDSVGAYRLDGVPIGSQSFQSLDQGLRLSTGGSAAIQEGLISTLDFTFVVNASTSGLQGSVVDPLGNSVPGAGVAYFDQTGAIVRGVTTDSNGNFDFGDTGPGGYRLWAYGSDLSTGNRQPDIGFVDVNVTTGHVASVVITLLGYGEVQGHVTSAHLDDKGNSVASPVLATLTLDAGQIVTSGPYARIAYPGDSSYPGAYQTDSESATGAYAFTRILGGSFTMSVHSAILGNQGSSGKIDHFGQIVTRDFNFQGSSSIDGYLYDEKGNPLPGVHVDLFSGTLGSFPGSSPLSTVTTISDATDPRGVGYFRFEGVPVGSKTVSFHGTADGRDRFAVGYASVPSAPVTIRTTLRAARVQDVRITVLEPIGGLPQPLAGASVSVSESDWPRRAFRANTGADGTVTFVGMSEGLYAVRAQSLSHTGSAGGCVCDEGGTSQVAITLTGSGSVHGTVLFPGSLTPVSNAQVLVFGNGLIGAGQTDGSGAYRIDGLPLGTALSVQVRDNASARTGFGPSFVLNFDGDDRQADVTLIALGFVTGTFSDSSGVTPISGATVTLYSSSALGTFVFRSGTDGMGGFTFGGIPQGSFSLSAAAGILRAQRNGSIANEGQTVNVPLFAEAVGSVSIHVVDSSGAELAAGSPPPIVTISGGGDTRTVLATQVDFDTIPVGVAYSVSAQEQASGPHHRAIGGFTVPAAGQVASVLLQYVPYGQVSVHVVRVAPDGSTTPITVGQVAISSAGLYSYQYPFGAWVGLNGAGEADFVDVGGGPLFASFRDPSTGISGSASGSISFEGQRVDLTISIAGTAQVRGHVMKPAPNDSVSDAGATVIISGSSSPTRATSTDANGLFVFDSVPYGGYAVTVLDDFTPGRLRSGFTLSVGGLVGNTLDVGNLVLDGIAPSVLSSSPPSGATNLGRNAAITFNFSEPVNGLQTLFAGSDAGTAAGNISMSGDHRSGTWVPVYDLLPGQRYVLTVPAGSYQDFNGWPGLPFSTEFTTLDNVGPSVVSTLPVNGSIQVPVTNGISVSFNQAIDPASASVSAITLSLVAPTAASIPGVVTAGANGTSLVFTPSVPALDPASLYRVTVSGVTDTVGNPMPQPYSYQFWTVDNQAPLIHFVNPPVSVLSLHAYSFSVAFDSKDISNLIVKINGAQIANFGQTLGDTSRGFSYRVDGSLAGGILIVSATPVDFSGNTGQPVELRIPVVADAPPAGTITLSVPGPVLAGQTVSLNASASDDLGLQFATVRVSGLASGSCSIPTSGQNQATGSCSFAIPISASVGGNVTFTLDLSDGYQEVQTGGTSLAVVRDSVNPVLGTISPTDGSTIASGSTVGVSVAASDDVAVARVVLQAGTSSTTLIQAPYNWSFRAPISGSTTDLPLVVTAYDFAGNSATRSVTLHVSPDQPPTGQMTLAPAGSILPGKIVTATIVAADDFGLSRIVATGSGAVSGSPSAIVSGVTASSAFNFTVPLNSGAGAPISISADVVDSVGQTTHIPAVSTVVAHDTTPPAITSTSPPDGSTFVSGDRVAISAAVSDDVAVKSVDFVVDGATATVAATPYSITYVAKAVTASTSVSVRVIAHDLAGNVSERDFSLQITPLNNVGAPVVKFLCPTSGALFPSAYQAPISVSAADDQGVARVEFLVDGSNSPFATVTTASAGIYSSAYSIPTSAADGSTITLRARAYDFANNIGETSTTFTIVSGDLFPSSATITNGSTNHDGHTIIVTGGVLTVIGHHVFDGLVVLSGASVTQIAASGSNSNAVDLDLGSRGFYVACGGSFDVTGTGYAGGPGGNQSGNPGQAFPGTAASGPWSGGSHGGRGADSAANGTVSGAAFDNVLDPAAPGGGGGSATGFYGGFRGGNGGGVVRIAGGTTILDGVVVADGEAGNSSGGAGGSIRLDVGTLAGGGSIRAQGGANAPGIENGQMGEPGGGGRIAIYGDSSQFDRTHVLARGGLPSGSHGYGGPGTVYFKGVSQTYGDLIVDSGSSGLGGATPVQPPLKSGTVSVVSGSAITDSAGGFPLNSVGIGIEVTRSGVPIGSYLITSVSADGKTLTLDGNVDGIVQANDAYRGVYRFDSVTVRGNVSFEDGLNGDGGDPYGTVRSTTASFLGGTAVVRGGLTLSNLSLSGEVMTTDASSSSTTTSLNLNIAGQLTVDPASRLDVTGAGYPGGPGNNQSGNPGQTSPGSAPSGPWSGGSHGGRGADNSANGTVSGAAFGSVLVPDEPGAGGGSGLGFYAFRGGNGGGVVRIAAGTLTLNGQIAADGEAGNASAGGGGSIRLDVTTLAGGGTIRAQGGANAPGVINGQMGEPGGGGRVAIYGDSSQFDRSHVLARGGLPSGSHGYGGPGTVYFKSGSQSLGDLIVDNGTAPASPTTPLVVAGAGRIGTVVSGVGGVTIVDANGNKVFPFGVVGEYLQISRSGAIVGAWRIVGYGTSSNSVVLDATADAQPGDSYQGLYQFDSVTVSGKSYLQSRDPILVPAINVAPGSTLEDPNHDPAPAGTVTVAPSGTVLQGGTLQITVNATDDRALSSIHISVTGAAMFSQTDTVSGTSASKTYTVPVSTSATGQIFVDASASDDIGVTTSYPEQVVGVVADVAPTIVLSTSPAGQVLAGQTLTVTATAMDDHALSSVHVMATGAATLDQVKTVSSTSAAPTFVVGVPVSAPNNGTITIAGTVTDANTHTTTAAPLVVSIQPDLTAPSIASMLPANGTQYTAGNTIVVSASITDNVGIASATISFDGQQTAFNAPYSTSYVAKPVFSPTQVPILVTATDYAGNISQASSTITINPLFNGNPPTIAITCPSTGAMFPPGYAIPISVSAAATQGVVRVDYFIDNATTPFATSSTSPYGATYTVPSTMTDGQTFVLHARVTDFANNVVDTTSTMTVVVGDTFTASATISATDVSHENHTVIVKAGTLTVAGHHAFNGMAVLGTAIVSQVASTSGSPGAVDLDLGTRGLYVSCGASINTSAKGYASNVSYPGASLAGGNDGGSHIGYGGHFNGPNAAPFGSTYRPAENGGGGNGGSAAGGVVRIVGSSVVVDSGGAIRANGDDSGNPEGAGGSIWITAGSVGGGGTVEARGGDHIGSDGFGAGGGGAISIQYGSSSGTFLSNLTARGGQHTSSYLPRTGGAGTIYLQGPTSVYGDLIVDNAGVQGYDPASFVLSGTTALSSFGGGVAQSASSGATLATTWPTNIPVYFVANWVKVTDATGVLKGIWRIESISGTSLSLSPNAGESITIVPGDVYQGIYRFDTVTVKGKAHLASSDPIVAGNFNGQSMLLDAAISGPVTLSGGTVTLTASGLNGSIGWNFDSLSLTNGTVLTVEPALGSQVTPLVLNVAGALNVDSTSSINVSGKGYSSNTTYPAETPSSGGSGGSHIGRGGRDDGGGGNPGSTFGSVERPQEFGAGGGSQTAAGGAGGGSVRLIGESVVLNGAILADGVAGSQSGGGAGGSIWITTGAFSGSGSMEALGGLAGFAPGGGGAVTVEYASGPGISLSHINAQGQTGGPSVVRIAGAGTVLVKGPTSTYGDLTIDNKGLAIGQWTELPSLGFGTAQAGTSAAVLVTDRSANVPGYFQGHWVQVTDSAGALKGTWQIGSISGKSVTLLPNGAESISLVPGDLWDGEYRFDSITSPNTAGLSSLDLVWVGGANGGALAGPSSVLETNLFVIGSSVSLMGVVSLASLNASDIVVQNGANLTQTLVSTNGAAPGLSIFATNSFSLLPSAFIDVSGRGYGSNGTYPGETSACCGSGGSHIGVGGRDTGGGGNPGSPYGNVEFPQELGGGGSSQFTAGGVGGGRVRILAPTVNLSGTIRSNGLAGGQSGGGAGGSVWIAAGSVTGDGSIQAVGGLPGFAPGGGGSIAVDCSNSMSGAWPLHLNAQGQAGNPAPARNSAAGTILLRRPGETIGELTVDNKGLGFGQASQLPALGSGTAQAGSTGAVLVTDRAASVPAYLLGHWVQVTGTDSLVKGTWRIGSISGKTITLVPNFNEVISIAPGDQWQGRYRFDSKSVTGGSTLSSVDSIDIGSFPVSSFTPYLDPPIEAEEFEEPEQ